MPSEKQMYITPADIYQSLNPSTLSIANPALVEHLIHDQTEVVALLSEIAPIAIDDISIDALGRVVIHNPGFATKVRSKLSQEGVRPVKNAGCGFFCATGTDEEMLEE